tara:strand:- start:266 stop:1009 length:744 start_codon:yes stop_codon:yes gene_type:complete
MENQFTLPTETVELPSKGLLYPEGNPLSSGTIEIKYMSAKEEDILTNSSYINDGTVIDKLLKSLIVSDINYNDLLVGDKNAIMIAARILGYGKDYEFDYYGETRTVDLTDLKDKDLHENYKKGENNFNFTLPKTNVTLSFKLLTHGDEQKIERELKGLKKINKKASPELTTRLKHIITSVNGDSESKTIRNFVDTGLLAVDARSLRKYYSDISPDVDSKFSFENSKGEEREASLPIGVNFFWPDADL